MTEWLLLRQQPGDDLPCTHCKLSRLDLFFLTAGTMQTGLGLSQFARVKHKLSSLGCRQVFVCHGMLGFFLRKFLTVYPCFSPGIVYSDHLLINLKGITIDMFKWEEIQSILWEIIEKILNHFMMVKTLLMSIVSIKFSFSQSRRNVPLVFNIQIESYLACCSLGTK